MHLLQVSYLQESDPRLGLALLAVIAAIALIAIIANLVRNGFQAPARSQGYQGSRRFSRWTLSRVAAAYGLGRDETDLLERIFRKAEVANPESTLSNTAVLDRIFKKSFKDIEIHAESESEAEMDKALLFSIRSTVEAVQSSTHKFHSSRNLSRGIPLTCISASGEKYPSQVLSCTQDQLVIAMPRNAVGTPLRFTRGTKVSITFYSKSIQGYQFQTRVLGSVNVADDQGLVLQHVDTIQTLPSRRFRRKSVQLSCFFFQVTIEQRVVGRKVEKKTIVDERRAMGTIMDISAGGCSIKTVSTIRTGEYVKIEFSDIRASRLVALGRIVRTNRAGAVGGIMHIQFLKAPRKTLNAIYSMVYSYDQD